MCASKNVVSVEGLCLSGENFFFSFMVIGRTADIYNNHSKSNVLLNENEL